MGLRNLRGGLEVDAHGPRQHALRRAAQGVVLGAALLACGARESAPPRTAATSSANAEAREVLPFRSDDYEGALAEAKRTHRPLFVDAWAPWCHSCQSMRAYVLTDPSLAPLAKDFVWLTIDTEKDDNAPFVTRFTNRVWPTLWVVDPAREAALLRWEGTATAPELVSLLATVRAGASEGGAGAAVAFLKANQAAARGELAEAEKGYRDVLAVKDAPDRARAVEALAGLLAGRKDHAACTELAVAESPSLPPGTSRATVLALGLSC
ncbi:MAG TPA: thioredoxin family protein, partial [Labilithrix sp.]|nr:thioredoxin family protein [Labilithrix sp.]